MLRKAIYGLIVAAFLAMNGWAVAADAPTLHQVYQAAQAGRLDEAQGMMQKVLQEHPNSGKAHFVEAEILAKQGKLGNAGEELDTAERLEPGLPFAKPQAVQELKSRIAAAHRNQPAMSGVHTDAAGGFPWGMLLLGIGAIAVISMIMRAIAARNSAPAAGNYPGNYQPGLPGPGGQPYPGGGVAPMAPAGGGIGSGIMSGLATGAAVGAGMVAGEALAHHFMDGGHGANAAPMPADSWNSSSNDMGGADFGVADSSSWDDAGVADSSGGDWD